MALLLAASPSRALALGQPRYISTDRVAGFPLVSNHAAATILIDTDDRGVLRAARDFRADIARVSDLTPELVSEEAKAKENTVIIGTLGKSPLIDRLAREGKIDVAPITGKWESFVIQTVLAPMPGIKNALIIAGSDKRGTIYGIYDVSEQIGVSPWYWWADVPTHHHDTLVVKPGRYSEGEPAVKYRGIFLNDEAPALTGWVKEKYGAYNHVFYEKVFELLLRLKANYLWPAMWNSAFSDDDPLNSQLADEYGIVMGTSHHEPMMRAQKEWTRHGKGPWDYSKNEAALRTFWEEGVVRNGKYQNIITLGMRGDGDMPMSQDANVALLEKVVADQRKIIVDKINPNLAQVPQAWALYKEVQEYYEKGMRVPEDVILLWSDDNFGNLRRVPTAEEQKRSGGAGIYYHLDYVGGPRSYKWLNTVPITKVWEQMNLAHAYGANQIWVVNVGDLKPLEFPMEFFLNLAREPDRWSKEKLKEYTRTWAEREFGPEFASDIADIVEKYAKYNGRRKPELLEPTTFSLVNYREAECVAEEFRVASEKAQAIYNRLPASQKDAFFQLVLYPTKACEQVTRLYITAGFNRLYTSQGRASTNDLARDARALFQADAELSAYYNHTLAGGKWDHMMDQTHIGFTFWNEPPKNTMPEVKEIELPSKAELGIAVEGSASAWPGSPERCALPRFDVFKKERHYIDLFNRGKDRFTFSIVSNTPWIRTSSDKGIIEKETRIWVEINWANVPLGNPMGKLTIAGSDGTQVNIEISATNPAELRPDAADGFVETDGCVSIEAEHYTRKIDTSRSHWEKIDDYGRTLSSMTVFPVNAVAVTSAKDAPCLQYKMYLFTAGKVEVDAYLAPTLSFRPGGGLKFAVALDDQEPQIIEMKGAASTKAWDEAVKDNIRILKSSHTVATAGDHTLKFWILDPGIVLQKIVVDLGGVKPSYLGPPESFFRRKD